MKQSKFRVLCALTLLLCFVVGQIILFSHQHAPLAIVKEIGHSSNPTVKANCQLCAAMYTNHFVINDSPQLHATGTCEYLFIAAKYHFTGISLILSAGRSPPFS